MPFDKEKTLRAAERYLEMGKIPAAVKEYCQLVEHEPNDFTTLNILGDLHVRVGNHAAAVPCFRRIADHYRDQEFALKAIAVYKQIREIIQKHVPEIADRYGHITPQLAELYAQLGLVSDALAAYDEVATQLQRSGQETRAVEVFKKK